jgi:hypothetical protein
MKKNTNAVEAANKPKAATKRQKTRKATIKKMARQLTKESGPVASIVKLAKKGYSKAEIIEAGFNKNTVYRQVREKVDLA